MNNKHKLCKDDSLPGDDNICCYCSPLQIDPDTNIPRWTAFQMKRGHDYFSVNWLDYFSNLSNEEQIEKIRKLYNEIFTVSKNGRMAELIIDETIGNVFKNSLDKRKLNINYQPSNKNKSHSGIFNYERDDQEVADLIRESVIGIHEVLI